MKFRIDRETFQKALQKVQGIVEKRNTMPILSNVLIEAEGERIDITATDLEVGMKSSYPAEVTTPGKITVSAKKLYEIVKELPENQVTFATKENDWVEIDCGKAHFSLVGLSSEEFPYFPRVKEEHVITLENRLVRQMIDQTGYAICSDETKYNLNGVFVKGEQTNGSAALRMVATDGHRLSLSGTNVEGNLPGELVKGVIFPRKGIHELKRMTEEEEGSVRLTFMENSAVVMKGNTVVVMRLVDGEFPDYNRVIPQANESILRINRVDFLHSLRRMSVLSSEKYKGIKLDVRTGGVEISSSNPELGEAREELDADYNGDARALRFNARYILDVLGVLPDEAVEVCLKDELSPALLRGTTGEEFMAVIMPMRL